MSRRLAIIAPHLTILLMVWSSFLLMGGCSSVEVDPFLESDRYFTIFGSFDMDFFVQHLRVIPIDQEIGARDDVLDATVTTTDLFSGEVWNWHDSVFTLTNGSMGHVFTSRFRIQAGRSYRTEVVRSDGAMSWAETTVPEQLHAVMGEAIITSPPEFVFPRGTQNVIWNGLTKEPHRVHVAYRFLEQDNAPFIDLVVPYDTKSSSDDTSESWQITVDYTSDYAFLKKEYIQDNPWRFVGALMRVQVLTDSWTPPGGIWDIDVLSQPGTFSNVHNGFGFVGSSSRFSVEWIP